MSGNGRKSSVRTVPKEDLTITPESREQARQKAESHAGRDRGKTTLRIDSRTVILVPPERATEKYVEAFRKRMNDCLPKCKYRRKGPEEEEKPKRKRRRKYE